MDIDKILESLPDLPRFVEARGMLLRGTADVIGNDLRHFGLYDAQAGVGVIIGTPPGEVLDKLVVLCGEESVLLAAAQNAEELGQGLSNWRCEIAHLHVLRDDSLLVAPGVVRQVTPSQIEAMALPDDLRQEMIDVSPYSSVAAAYVDGRPVSFVYDVWRSESFWDVSIDTLEPYQRQGHAARAVSWMIRRQAQAGRSPVWGAVESNTASMRLAAKLGFAVVDRIAVFGQRGGDEDS